MAAMLAAVRGSPGGTTHGGGTSYGGAMQGGDGPTGPPVVPGLMKKTVGGTLARLHRFGTAGTEKGCKGGSQGCTGAIAVCMWRRRGAAGGAARSGWAVG
jgi:hypothetical protein